MILLSPLWLPLLAAEAAARQEVTYDPLAASHYHRPRRLRNGVDTFSGLLDLLLAPAFVRPDYCRHELLVVYAFRHLSPSLPQVLLMIGAATAVCHLWKRFLLASR